MTGTIHIIDDDASVRVALQRVLSSAGYTTRCYAAAGDYLLPPPDPAPGCLLLDLQLRGFSGLDLQEALPRHPGYERPIVFLSGADDVRASVRAMRSGAREFLTKPVDFDVLLAAVEDAIQHDVRLRTQRREAQEARKRARWFRARCIVLLSFRPRATVRVRVPSAASSASRAASRHPACA